MTMLIIEGKGSDDKVTYCVAATAATAQRAVDNEDS